MVVVNDRISIKSQDLLLDATIVPWDTEVFQFPVAQIDSIHISDPKQSVLQFKDFESWRNLQSCDLVSCRLSEDQLVESMFLEEKGFRFIEMVLHPKVENLHRFTLEEQGLTIRPAEESDLLAINKIAMSAFRYERFYVDPRLDSHCSDLRYKRWVSNVLGHPKQQLLKILDKDLLIGFFIIEIQENGSAYWHLTAISPLFHGKGYGYRTWLAMIQYHRLHGHMAINTTISARNVPVLNLYSKLHFHFSPPEMSFHWMRK